MNRLDAELAEASVVTVAPARWYVRAVPSLQILAFVHLAVVLLTPDDWYEGVAYYDDAVFGYLFGGGVVVFLSLLVVGENLRRRQLLPRTAVTRVAQACSVIGLGVALAFSGIFATASLIFYLTDF